ncbi:MAG: PilZ domain-containing protein [Desulfocapsa sp.]|nr:PilZ domain-containing protein [Desulfocapsa sp.]
MAETKDGTEKRGGRRRHLVFYLRIFDGMSSRVLGHLMDISPGGLMLLSDEPIEVNEEHRLRMRLPKDVSGNKEIMFEAVSRWCRPDESPEFFVTGFQIQDIDTEMRESLSRLIEDFGFQD